MSEDYYLLTKAQERLKKNEGKKAMSFEDVMQNFGISEDDIENAEDPDIE